MRRWLAVAVGLVVVAVLVVAAVVLLGLGRHDVPIHAVEGDPASTELVVFGSCEQNTQVDVVETETQVRLRADEDRPGWGVVTACGRLITVELQEPLGDRAVVDTTTGRTVPVSVRSTLP